MNTLQVKTSIKPLELQRLLPEGAPAQLLDVRTPGEFAAAHVPGAKLIPLDDLNPGALQRQRGSMASLKAWTPSRPWLSVR